MKVQIIHDSYRNADVWVNGIKISALDDAEYLHPLTSGLHFSPEASSMGFHINVVRHDHGFTSWDTLFTIRFGDGRTDVEFKDGSILSVERQTVEFEAPDEWLVYWVDALKITEEKLRILSLEAQKNSELRKHKQAFSEKQLEFFNSTVSEIDAYAGVISVEDGIGKCYLSVDATGTPISYLHPTKRNCPKTAVWLTGSLDELISQIQNYKTKFQPLKSGNPRPKTKNKA